MNNNHYVFCHGWGFNKHFWNPLLKYFNKQRCTIWNLGYYGKEEIIYPEKQKIIGIGHSLGMAKLLTSKIKFNAIIGLQSFINFLGNEINLKEKRLIEWKQTKIAFKQSPQKTLKQFYNFCGATYLINKTNEANFNKLNNDLNSLLINYEIPDCPILIIGSKNDPIVTEGLLKDNFDDHLNVKIKMLEIGAHGLGFNLSENIFKEIHNEF